jgi:hypothetical protein
MDCSTSGLIHAASTSKSDKAELSSAIQTMFHWYQNATKCYVYLSDVSTKRGKLAVCPPSLLGIQPSGQVDGSRVPGRCKSFSHQAQLSCSLKSGRCLVIRHPLRHSLAKLLAFHTKYSEVPCLSSTSKSVCVGKGIGRLNEKKIWHFHCQASVTWISHLYRVKAKRKRLDGFMIRSVSKKSAVGSGESVFGTCTAQTHVMTSSALRIQRVDC